MAGDALPLAGIENPGIGKTSDMVVDPALVRALGVVRARNHCGVAKEIHFDVTNIGDGRFEKRVFDVGQKFLLVTDFAVVLGVHKLARNQGVEDWSIAIDLRLVPKALENEQLAFARIGLLGGQPNRTQSKK